MDPNASSEERGERLLARVLRYFDGGSKGEETPAPGTELGGSRARYAVAEEIGSGGMGIVFRALDGDLGRDVALKVARSSGDAAHVDRFLAEARITGQLEHPNIVPVHELGRDADGKPFFTMKLVQGRTLEQWIRELQEGEPGAAERSLDRGLQVVLKVCDALAFAHARGVVHRDLKPANVMVGDFGEVLVMDWGLAKRLGDANASSPLLSGSPDASGPETLAGAVLGSPSFMAPEQARGDVAAIDQRTDVFGVGGILHQLLTGRPPYTAATRDEVVSRAAAGHLSDPAMGLAKRAIPRELRATCAKALAARPEDRYPSIAALAADLQAYVEGRPGTAWRDGLPARIVKLARRHPARATGVAAAALVVLASLIAIDQARVARAEGGLRKLESQRREEAERDEVNRRFLAQLRELRSAGSEGGQLPYRPDLALLRQYLDAFALRGVPLNDSRPATEVSRLLAELGAASPELAREIKDGLYDLARQMERHGIASAAWATRGAPPTWAKGADLEKLMALPREHPWLVSLAERLAAILEAIEDDPWRKEVWRAWLAKGGGERRLDPFVTEDALRGRSASELEWLGETFLAIGNGGTAIQLLDRAIELDPSLPFARFYRAEAAQATGDLALASFHYRVAIALRPHWSSAHNNLAVVLRAQGDTRAAITAWRRAVASRPENANACTNLGAALAERGRAEEAILFCRKAVELRPDLAEAQINLGNVLTKARKLDEAVAAYDKAIELRPDLVQAHFNLGNARRARGDLEAAVAAFRKATEIAPDHAEAHCNLGNALVQAGRPAEAVPFLRRGHELGSKRPGWRYDSEKWLREAEELAGKEK